MKEVYVSNYLRDSKKERKEEGGRPSSKTGEPSRGYVSLHIKSNFRMKASCNSLSNESLLP